jgi:D-alanine-D-alanine ligase
MSAESVLAALGGGEFAVTGVRIGFDRPLAELMEALERVQPDVVFPLVHGPFGEDGTIQGILEWAGLPYVGSDVAASSVCMDKGVTKAVLNEHGLPVVRSRLMERQALQDPRDALDLGDELGYPLFVKPASLGSSVGVSKVHAEDELLSALSLAARYDRRILVEEAVSGREIECAVLGDRNAETSVLGEIFPSHEFYDYEAKYTPGTRIEIPARIDPGTAAEIRSLAQSVFRAVDGRDLARVDFFLSDDGRIYVNEVNSLPGFTEYSMYPQLWRASGLPYPDLLGRLVRLAEARGPRPRIGRLS